MWLDPPLITVQYGLQTMSVVFSHYGISGPESNTLRFVDLASWRHHLDVRRRYVWLSSLDGFIGAKLLSLIAGLFPCSVNCNKENMRKHCDHAKL